MHAGKARVPEQARRRPDRARRGPVLGPAENGATAHELMAIFGWIDIKEAEIYTRAADRKRLAAQSMSKLEA